MRRLTLKYLCALRPCFFLRSLAISSTSGEKCGRAAPVDQTSRQYSGLIVPFLLLHACVREVRDGDELGMTPRQHAASSIIHLGNKLINSVNEEEQRGLKEPFSGWRHRVAHINHPGT